MARKSYLDAKPFAMPLEQGVGAYMRVLGLIVDKNAIGTLTIAVTTMTKQLIRKQYNCTVRSFGEYRGIQGVLRLETIQAAPYGRSTELRYNTVLKLYQNLAFFRDRSRKVDR